MARSAESGGGGDAATPMVDLAIIGGGINGCGIARDAAGRGYSVYLCEKDDLASGTSSWSTKLIHGGLRYLEYYKFRLVREALQEREVLWAIAPHIIHPLRFVLPHHKGLRPAWLLRLGLFLYDHIGGRGRLPATRTLDLTKDVAGLPLKKGDGRLAFEYSDCSVDDARLVVLNARDAAARGAIIRTRSQAVSATRESDGWTVHVRSSAGDETVRARVLVNAAGPWVADVLTKTLGLQAAAKVRQVQGSHIVVRKLYDHDRCYIFQNADNRIIFAIPYRDAFTLIGTTDRDWLGAPDDVKASDEEIDYLCAAASDYFVQPVTRADIVWTYSGVRPLYDDGSSAAQAATRDYVLDVDDAANGAPLLSVFGGKITTYRRLAEHALEKLHGHLGAASGLSPGWTARAPLPGGAFPTDGFGALIDGLARDYPFLTRAHAQRLAGAYGLDARELLGTAKTLADLGEDFGATLTAVELRWLCQREWAQTADDVLWRRSKLGLALGADAVARVEAFLATARPAAV